MTELTADNLETRVNENGEVVIEPSYISYLREHGYIIEEIHDIREVDSEGSDGGHIIVEIETYQYPRDHQELDYVEHKMKLKVCDCWSWRTNSNDVADGKQPGGKCKHVTSEFMVEQAQNSDSQQTL
jgi:hypothetical protein